MQERKRTVPVTDKRRARHKKKAWKCAQKVARREKVGNRHWRREGASLKCRRKKEGGGSVNRRLILNRKPRKNSSVRTRIRHRKMGESSGWAEVAGAAGSKGTVQLRKRVQRLTAGNGPNGGRGSAWGRLSEDQTDKWEDIVGGRKEGDIVRERQSTWPGAQNTVKDHRHATSPTTGWA